MLFASMFAVNEISAESSGAGDVPEFPSYTDPVMETSIEEDETPL